MNEPEQTSQQDSPTEGESPAKKPYEKPEAKYERVFETMALSCGKVQATQGSCRRNRKAS